VRYCVGEKIIFEKNKFFKLKKKFL